MNTKIATLLAALMVSLPVSFASASEAMKIGYVNTQRIFRDAPTAVKAAKRIEAEFSKRDQDLKLMAKQIQGLQESLEKNAVTMPESERRAKEKDLKLKLYVLGDGPEKEFLMNLSEKLGVRDKIYFAGFVTEKRLY